MLRARSRSKRCDFKPPNLENGSGTLNIPPIGPQKTWLAGFSEVARTLEVDRGQLMNHLEIFYSDFHGFPQRGPVPMINSEIIQRLLADPLVKRIKILFSFEITTVPTL